MKKSIHKAEAPPAKKVRVVSVRLTEEEYQTVLRNLKITGRKLSDYWRRSLLNAKVTPIATAEDMLILRQIGGEGNNLNQLTKLAHQAGILKVKWEIEAVLKLLRSLYKRLSHDWKVN